MLCMRVSERVCLLTKCIVGPGAAMSAERGQNVLLKLPENESFAARGHLSEQLPH